MRIYLIGLMYLLLLSGISGQEDLYSISATRQFADYLFQKGEFEFAGEEYARLLFLNPESDSIRVRLSQAYRKQGRYDLANNLFSETPKIDLKNAWVENEFLATLIFKGDSMALREGLLRIRYLPEEEQLRKKIEFAMMNRELEVASSLLRSADANLSWTEQYQQTIDRAQAFHPKKPWLAATFSAIIPGSGKVYSRNVKEGVTSFFFVAALGYQSYRAFSKRGSKAVGGWIYGGLSLGFYLGNIYGSHQSAKNYNKRQFDRIYHEMDQNILDRY